jgi:hypothetical protein
MFATKFSSIMTLKLFWNLISRDEKERDTPTHELRTDSYVISVLEVLTSRNALF